MSFSIQRAVSDGTLALLPISIEYFDREEISVLFDGVVNALPWSWVGVDDATISFTPPIPNMVEVSILRSTDLSALRHSFSMGAQFTATSLDESLLQILHIAQESKEGSGLGEVYQNLNFHGFKAINMGDGSAPGDAVNHAQMQVHDATIVGYMNAADASADAAAASAVAAAAGAASIHPGVPLGVATLNSVGKVVQTALQADVATNAGNATTAASATTATTATTAANLAGRAQLGTSGTATQNFTLTAESADGTMKLARGNAGATTQDILTINAAGLPDFPTLARTLGTTGSYTLPGGLVIKWGVVNTSAGADTAVTFATPFTTALYCVFGQQPYASTVVVNFQVVPSSGSVNGFYCNSVSPGGRNAMSAYWLAIGK